MKLEALQRNQDRKKRRVLSIDIGAKKHREVRKMLDSAMRANPGVTESWLVVSCLRSHLKTLGFGGSK